MSSSTWTAHFKDRLVGLETPAGGSLLEVALSEDRIPEGEYLSWASRNLLYPILNDDFFAEQQANPELLKKIPHPWKATLFPVAEWDGHLIVAGLERPDTLPEPIGFVLASRHAMALWWESLSEHVPLTEAPEGIDIGGNAVASVETPEGLSEEPAAPALNFSNLRLNTAPQSTEVPVEFPEHVTADIQSVLKEEALDAEPEPSISKAPPAPLHQAPTGPVVFTQSQSQEPNLLTPFLLSHAQFKNEAKKALTDLCAYFPKVMLFALTAEGSGLAPVLWNEEFGQPPVPGKVTLGAASLFNIMATTEKPFHGPVVPNDVNNAFFALWNQSKTPEHVTLAPLFFKGRLVGALYGQGSQDSYTMSVLRACEKISAELTRKIGGALEDGAAA